MEHRHAKRVPLNERHVMIHEKNVGVTRGRVINLSLEGLLVKTSAFPFRKHTFVEIIFNPTSPNNDRENPFRVKAMVVHKSPAGVGLMFASTEFHSYHQIKQMIATAEPVTSANDAVADRARRIA